MMLSVNICFLVLGHNAGSSIHLFFHKPLLNHMRLFGTCLWIKKHFRIHGKCHLSYVNKNWPTWLSWWYKISRFKTVIFEESLLRESTRILILIIKESVTFVMTIFLNLLHRNRVIKNWWTHFRKKSFEFLREWNIKSK